MMSLNMLIEFATRLITPARTSATGAARLASNASKLFICWPSSAAVAYK